MVNTVNMEPSKNKNFWRLINFTERALIGPLNIAIETPNEVVWMWERSTLIRYSSPTKKNKYKEPILIVPPLMVKPTIFDLRPAHSMIGSFVESGFEVFVVDFGIPQKHDKIITVDDYVTDFIPNAIEKIMSLTNTRQINIIGWSMGGIMNLLYTALFKERSHVKNMVIIGSPVDYSKMFPFNILAKAIEITFVRELLDLMGNIPPVLTRNGFRILAPLKLVQRYFMLVEHYWDREWVAAYESINNWVEDFIPYPGEAFKQFVTDFIKDDKLRKGQLKIKGKHIDLKNVTQNMIVFVGTKDVIAAPKSVEAVLDFVSSKDKTAKYVPLGHIGLVAGGKAPDLVWNPITEWLSERCEKTEK